MSYSTIDKEAQPIVSEAPSYYSKKFLAGAVVIAFVMGAAAATATASVPAVSTSTYLTHPPASTYTFTSKAQLKTAVNAWTSNNQDEHSEALNYYGPISKWDVSPIMDMSELFKGKNSFNDDISAWDVSRVTTMQGMFEEANAFNHPLKKWDVSSVTDMSNMFAFAYPFNQPLNDWVVSRVTTMAYMFFDAEAFNQPLNDWDVSSVTDMSWMFYCYGFTCAFNQPLDAWDVSSVTDISYMFYDAYDFNQNLRWCLSSNVDTDEAFTDSGCPHSRSRLSCGVTDSC